MTSLESGLKNGARRCFSVEFKKNSDIRRNSFISVVYHRVKVFKIWRA